MKPNRCEVIGPEFFCRWTHVEQKKCRFFEKSCVPGCHWHSGHLCVNLKAISSAMWEEFQNMDQVEKLQEELCTVKLQLEHALWKIEQLKRDVAAYCDMAEQEKRT